MLRLCCLFIHLIMLEPVLRMITKQPKKVESDSSMVSLMFTRRQLLLMELLVYIVVSPSHVLGSLCIEVFTLECMTH